MSASTSETRERAAVRQAFIVEDLRPLLRNTLRGFLTVIMPSGMVLSEVAIHASGDSVWASPASKPMVSREGAVLRDQAGNVRYAPIVSFTSKARRDAFSRQVIEALIAD